MSSLRDTSTRAMVASTPRRLLPGIPGLVGALAAFLLLPLGTPAAAGESLFTTDVRAPASGAVGRVLDDAGSGEASAVERSRIARVDYEGLGAVREAVVSGRTERLRLNLLDGVEFEAAIERSAPTASGYSLSGPLRGVPFGRAVLVVNGDIAVGRVYTPEAVYAIRTLGGMQSVERREPEPLRCATEMPAEAGAGPADGAVLPVEPPVGGGFEPYVSKAARATSRKRSSRTGAAHGASGDEAVASGDDDVVDVLVVYPSFVREIEGGYGHMLALIDLDIATANEAYAASGVEFRVELADAVEVDYDWFLETWFTGEANRAIWRNALDHLADRDDGYLEEVHALRDRHAADLVLLHLGGEVHAEVARFYVAGIAYVVSTISSETVEERGFSVARSADGTVVAHELGHSMGLRHDRYADVGNEPFPYSHGFRYEHAGTRVDGTKFNPRIYGTIMSQYSGVGFSGFVLAFSNPALSHPDDPDLKLGVPGDAPSPEVDGPADAARHLNELRGTLANVRARADADPCRYVLSGDEEELPAEGGTYAVRLETGADCAWEAWGGEWVESVSVPSGTGSGEIGFEVSANDGWARPVEVVVAGRVHGVKQAGSRPITPVCERSGPIASRLTHRHPDKRPANNAPSLPCHRLNFDADYLASLRHITLKGNSTDTLIDGSALRPGDFDGLTGLIRLGLENVETLPADTFYGLTGLRYLEVGTRFGGHGDATLTTVVPGAFRGLSGVKMLRLGGHRLRGLEPDTFEGLSGLLSLTIIDAQGAPLTLKPGVFNGLPSLLGLFLYQNRLAQLEPRVFDGLSKLTQLNLQTNALSSLPVDAFEGLSALKSLVMHYNQLTALPVGLFDGLSNLEELALISNQIAALEPGVFDGLSNLKTLELFDNRLRPLAATVFDGLSNLELLWLSSNRIATLEPGLFDGLSNLEFLELGQNRLSALKPGIFGNLSSLRILNLTENGISTLESGVFDGLTNLKELYLGGNSLDALPPGRFEELRRLEYLVLWGNRLGPVSVGAFDGLRLLYQLNLWRTGITSFEPGVFDATPILRRITLRESRFRELAPGTLRGLDLWDFDLRGNPGAPFTFAPTPVALPLSESGVGQPLEIAVEIASAVPFGVNAALSATGGTLSRREVRIAAGKVRAEDAVTVTPDGDGPVTVRIDGQPAVISSRSNCNGSGQMGLTSGYCYRGMRVEAGPPLVLYGLADRDLTLGRGAETVDLSGVFSYFLGAADYTASSSDDGVAAVTVEDGTMTVTPGVPGSAEVTVTATGPDGETVTRHFSVTVRVPSVPFFLAGSDPAREGFVRLINRSDAAGEVRITAIDGGGARREPVSLQVGANAAVHFNSGDLERGNASKGLSGGIGFGEGGWRLEFESDLDIEALAYVRTADGFLTAMHDLAPADETVRRVATFNPADNAEQVSRLRIVNPGREAAAVTVRGVDDAGSSPGGAVRFTVPAGATREYTATELETGSGGLAGALGNGEGKWRLVVESHAPVAAMSLLENLATGHLTNLSSVPPPVDGNGVHHVPLFPAASDSLRRQGFARVVNRTARSGLVRIVAYDDLGERYGPLELALGTGETAHFNSEDLELGNAAKGLSGGTGAGEGDWRLELTSDLDIETLAYIRTEDGFLTAMHDAAALVDGAHRVAVFNPGGNADQVSRLRLVNPSSVEVRVEIQGTDDAGTYPDGAARVRVPAGAALTLTAAELEAGVPSEHFEGNWDRNPLGDRAGKWRLVVAAEAPMLVMSLLESPTGHLTNLSTAPGS